MSKPKIYLSLQSKCVDTIFLRIHCVGNKRTTWFVNVPLRAKTRATARKAAERIIRELQNADIVWEEEKP